MRKKVVLACTECMSRNYTTDKQQKEGRVDRLETRKYCKTCGAHTLHRETK
ncbi:50S ribosomal protein L33 [Pontibacillus halophilus]|uniref:50S ribosomal protein L33 n=1 Tax=Pontibacillus halophilus TaxID=516704 RepID=UPI0009DC4AA5|nr:50S ribosomal protein L33 [Pontibacillus halophilus]